MKVVRVMIAAAEELHHEMLEFTSLIEHLNKVLKPRGIELKRVKWIPEEEKSDFQDKLKDCEFCLKLYWTNFSNNSEKELKLAYDRLKQGDNPKNLYVFFKEPALDISDALKDFKANFVTNYGHFFCKFENVDTMNLHFILQFEDLQNRIDSNVLSIKDGNVLVGGKPIANLDNIPFAALNKEYQRLKKELRDLDEQLAVLKKSFSENPADNDILSELVKVSTNRNKVSEEFEKHQNYLFNIAINFAKKSEQLYSERLAKARELFEKGEVSEADRLLNLDLMKREAEAELAMRMQHDRNLDIKIEEFQTKAEMVMANEDIDVFNRFTMACDAFNEAIRIAQLISTDKNNLYKLLRKVGNFYFYYGEPKTALSYFDQCLQLLEGMTPKEEEIIIGLKIILCNTILILDPYSEDAILQEKRKILSSEALQSAKKLSLSGRSEHKFLLAKTSDTYKNYQDALDIYDELRDLDPENYISYYANSLRNNGKYQEALKFYSELATKSPSYIEDKAETLMYVAGQSTKDDAEKTYKESLSIYEELLLDNPSRFCPKILEICDSLAEIYLENSFDNKDIDFIKTCERAIEVCKQLADISPSSFNAKYIDKMMRISDFMHQYYKDEKDVRIITYNDVLSILLKINEIQPENVCDEISCIYHDLAELYHQTNQNIKELNSYEKALHFYDDCLKNGPHSHYLIYAYAICMENYGMALKNCDQSESALENLKRSLLLLEELINDKVWDYYTTINDIKRINKEINSITYEEN